MVTPAAPIAQGYDPINILRAVRDGDITVTLPAIKGHYGHGLQSFDVVDDRDEQGRPKAPMAILHARIKDGKVDTDPAHTYVSFHPPLQIGTILNVKTLGMELKQTDLWQYTDDHNVDIVVRKQDDIPESFRASGKPFVGARVQANLSHYLDFLPFLRHMDITKGNLGVEGLPLLLADDGSGKPGLYEALEQHAKEIGGKVQQAMGNPFDTSKYSMQVDNCRLRAGQLNLPAGLPTVVLGKSNTMTVSASPTGVSVKGHFDVPRFSGAAGASQISGSDFAADGFVQIALDPKTKAPTQITVTLDNTSGRLADSHLSDGNGTQVDVASAKLSGAHFVISTKLDGVSQPEVAGSFSLKTKMSNAQFAVQEGPTRIPVTVADAEFDGLISVAPGYVAVNAKHMDITASAPGVTLGGGALRIGTTTATVTGSGALQFDNGVMKLSSPDLKLHAEVASGHFDAGAVSADIAAGTKIDLSLTQAQFGGAKPTFHGSGALTLALAGGQLRSPHNVRDILPGAIATLTADSIAVDETGVSARGSLVIDSSVSSTGSDTIDVANVHADIKGDSETLHAEATAFTLDHGKLTLGEFAYQASAHINAISGRITLPKGTPASSMVALPKIETSPVSMPDITGIKQPDNVAMVGLIDNADVAVRFKVLPRTYTKKILGKDIDFTFPAHPTTVSVSARVRGGSIEKAGGAEVVFSPALSLPEIGDFPADEVARYFGATLPEAHLDTHGNIIVELCGTTLDLGPSPVSRKLTDLVKKAGMAAPGATPPSVPVSFADLTVVASNVTLNAATVPLANDTYLTTAPGTKLGMVLDPSGQVSVSGHFDLGNSDIHLPGFDAHNLTGSTDATIVLDAAGALHATLPNLTARVEQLRLKSHDDVIALDSAQLTGKVSITVPKKVPEGQVQPLIGVECTLTNVEGTLSKDGSRMFVTVDGHRVAASVGSGTLSNGTMSLDRSGALQAGGTLTNMTGAVEKLPLQLGGVQLDVEKAAISTPKDKSATFALQNGKLDLEGEIDAEAKISAGRIGAPGTAFNLALGGNTTAKLRFKSLVVGTVAKDTKTVVASGILVFNLKGGELLIPDPRGGKLAPFKLRVTPGTSGRVDLGVIERTQGQDYAKVRGALDFNAKFVGVLPKNGVQIPTETVGLDGKTHKGTFSIDSVESNNEKVHVHIDGLAMENDGRFGLSGINLTQDADVKGVTASISDAAAVPAARVSSPSVPRRRAHTPLQ